MNERTGVDVESSTVSVYIFWLPFGESYGRIVALRRVRQEDVAVDLWASDLTYPVESGDLRERYSADIWRRLFSNEWMRVIEGPVPLWECLAGTTVRAEIEERLNAGEGAAKFMFGVTVELADLGWGAEERIPPRFTQFFRLKDGGLSELFERSLSEAAEEAHAWYRDAERGVPGSSERLDHEIADMIRFEGSRGAQVGRYNVQINTFTATYEGGSMDFHEVFQRASVRMAIARLQLSPGDSRLRSALVSAFSHEGWGLFASPRYITVERQQRGILDFLCGLIGIGVEGVRGLQVGDENKQINSFLYQVTATPTAAQILSRNHGLATALADFFFPRPGNNVSLGELRDTVTAQLEQMPISWKDDITRGATYPLGAVRVVRGHDGVSVGEDITVFNTEAVSVSELEVELPDLVPFVESDPLPGLLLSPPLPPVREARKRDVAGRDGADGLDHPFPDPRSDTNPRDPDEIPGPGDGLGL
ncbi:hypothetical protein [Actinoplanes ianthinogenes]|uniref:hypothetical protein n=1 Tax=Actinoplanes ianthinogenes TaxID=122358 RepID=UPI0016712ABA|nr:hypothetical protein [Actinoplanes ianthinogenes]